ncbi:hypothetical protein CEXT_72771 [Caerostris extrusa]|uniref:Uncharacterized protein n=1 Tax=Caerostris extrusa TaxID=172846 RepID=A0AAV4TNH8_CAEEX|nr:hypothetical protein CEXT_72771 [Caerostris extrusa]
MLFFIQHRKLPEQGKAETFEMPSLKSLTKPTDKLMQDSRTRGGIDSPVNQRIVTRTSPSLLKKGPSLDQGGQFPVREAIPPPPPLDAPSPILSERREMHFIRCERIRRRWKSSAVRGAFDLGLSKSE